MTQQAFYAYFEERARKLKLDRIEFLTYSTKAFRNGREIKTPKCIQKAETLYNRAFSAGMHDRWLRGKGWSVGLGSMAASIKDVYAETVRAAVAETERRARLVLESHAGIREFCMSMGCWVFSDLNDDEIDRNDPRLRSFAGFVDEWDEYLRITGTPVRFTRNGPRITDW